MKSGVICILGIIFALLVFSSVQKNEREVFKEEISQSVKMNTNSDCLVPEINFAFKKSLQKVISFRLEHFSFIETFNKINENIVSTLLVSFHRKNLSLKHFSKIPFRLILYFSSDNPDSHSLI